MSMDFNTADKQQVPNALIPQGTKVKVIVKVRPGGQGDGGWLKLSKAGDKRMLDLEMTVLDGDYMRRKMWELMTVDADAPTDSVTEALNISRARIRAILESARCIKPDDQSPAAEDKRKISTYGDLDGLIFATTVRIEKDKTGSYPDKNRLGVILTPEKADYSAVMSGAGPSPSPSKAPAAQGKSAGKPSWAQ